MNFPSYLNGKALSLSPPMKVVAGNLNTLSISASSGNKIVKN